MQKHTLQGEKRTVIGRKVKTLRTSGKVPATVYGRDIKSASLSIPETDFRKLYVKAGNTGLVDLVIDKKDAVPVLIHHVQVHPVTDFILHVEFHQVDLKEKVHAQIPLVVEGESPAVEQKQGVLLSTLDEVEVEALPADLPEHLVVDISNLSEVGSELTVSDLKIPKGVTVLTQQDLTVAKIDPLVTHEEEPAPVEAPEAGEGQEAEGESGEETKDAAKPKEEKAGKEEKSPKE